MAKNVVSRYAGSNSAGMVKAFIATEDSRFYEHHGVDPVGIFRAASVAMFSGHASQGRQHHYPAVSA
ncbi:transglycosylase domain-containing protein [Acinetobacter baumannii]|uniref:transglycosylase domain-containing protein n=1 Tax=Acinetobacter baumannii TaxID=470 RepID=UPI003D301252